LVGRPEIGVERRLEADLRTGCAIYGIGRRNRIFADADAGIGRNGRVVLASERAALELLAAG
jgi:hypothetical protein